MIDPDVVKRFTGNDRIEARDFYENPFKSKYYFLWFNNNIRFESESESETEIETKSRNISKINLNSVLNNENEEYVKAFELFEIRENILSFSKYDYEVIYLDDNKCFYVKEIKNKKIFKCVEEDIKLIHKSIYGESKISQKLKSITKL
jgi:hypothetical protein